MDAPSEGPGMNSRSHHMWSSIGQALYESLAGLKMVSIDDAETIDSAGWQFVQFVPAAVPGLSRASATLNHERGTYAIEWSRTGGIQCGKVSEQMDLAIDCSANGGQISSIDFAAYGQPFGQCGEYGNNYSCDLPNVISIVQGMCVGQATCVVNASNTVFGGDPCNGFRKWLVVQAQCSQPSVFTAAVSLPPNSQAVLKAPYLSFNGVKVSESGMPVYANQRYVPGVNGVTGAGSYYTGTVDLMINSGDYKFVATGTTDTHHVCGVANELNPLTLTCSNPNEYIARVVFASFGTSPVDSCPSESENKPHVNGEAPPQVYTIGSCHAGTSRVVFERACLGKNTCTVLVENDTFGGDPCYGTTKHAVVDVSCAAN